MPPKMCRKPRDSIERERVLVAVSALKKPEISIIREAAHIYNISVRTIYK